MEYIDKPLTINDASELTGLSKGYLYKLIHFHKIPFYKPNNGRVYFKKEELEKFIFRGRNAADYELEEKGTSFINSKKGRKTHEG
jgi:excisionase family DNA binding protein